MKNVTEYMYPSDITQALSLYAEQEHSAYIAGGTHLVAENRNNTIRLIDITRLGMNEIIGGDESIEVGATATITDMYNSPVVNKVGNGVLTKACQQIGDTPLRNAITLGGNIARLYTWAGLPVVLLTLDAEVEIINPKGETKTLPAVDHFAKGGVKGGDLILKVFFPHKNSWFHSYEKFSLTTSDYTWLTIAFAAEVKEGTITDVRFAVSRITKVTRLAEVEKALMGQKVKEIDFKQLLTILETSVDIVSDYRVSKEYRKHILGVLFTRMLKKLQEESL
ncbi:MAG: FAD binding domain-containing protein [Candidatus Hodarchaeales archaeon]|jgi:carbon-monoxide dehydrogenase medium subunit